MSILVRSAGAPGLTAERYDETMPRSEIWDSNEQFEAFGQHVMPILTESGVELACPPEVIEIHKIIKR